MAAEKNEDLRWPEERLEEKIAQKGSKGLKIVLVGLETKKKAFLLNRMGE